MHTQTSKRAVAVLTAALIGLASPASSEPAEPAEGAASEGPGLGAKIFDVAVLRPGGFATVLVGAGLFVPAALMAAPGGLSEIRAARDYFIDTPVQHTFVRRLGKF